MRGVAYLFVQGSHHIIVFADLRRCREQDTPDWDRVFRSQLYPLATDFDICICII